MISGNETAGVVIRGNGAQSNIVEGNYIGIGLDGLSPVPNGIGVLIIAGANANTIGGTSDHTQRSRNVISGNRGAGVEIVGLQGDDSQGSDPTSDNVIAGNYIGLDWTGTTRSATRQES